MPKRKCSKIFQKCFKNANFQLKILIIKKQTEE